MNSRQFLDLAEAIKNKQLERCLEIITQNPEVLDQVSRTNEICADAISQANSNSEVKRGQITGTGLTPLHLAVISGNIPIIQLLLGKRPDLIDRIPIGEGNNIQLTPLELAFYFEDEVLISLLFENGADIKLVQNHFKSIGEEEKLEQNLLALKNTQLAEKIRQKLKPASNVDGEKIQPEKIRQMLIDAYTQALWNNLISKTNGVVGNIRPNVVRSLYEELAAKIKYDFKQDPEKAKLFAETVIDEEVIKNILIDITNNLKNDKIHLKMLGHTRTWFTNNGKESFKLLLNVAKAWPDVFEEIKPTPVDNKTVTENPSPPKQDAVTTREPQTQLENNDEDLLGFGNTQEAHNIGIDTSPMPTGTPAIESRFKREIRLQPDDVYYAACGIFNEHQFTCIDAIPGDGYLKELAKIYRRSDDGMLYIMYYPGKDNHHPTTLENLAQPLDHIMQKANDAIAKKYGTLALNNAKKIFVLAESNTYFGVSIRHYIKGDLTNGTLTTVDSINRSYDESYITQSKHLAHAKRKVVKTGYQNMILDKWTCGYHSLEAIERDIMGQAAPEDFEVTDDVITKHDRYYKSGLNTVVVSTSSLQENTEISILMKGAEEEPAQQRDTSSDAAYNADEINACIESYELSRYPEFLIQPDSIKEKNGGYDAFSLVTQNEDSIFGDDNFFLRILLHYIRNQISKGKNTNQLRIAIPLHFGSEGSGHYVPFGIQLDDINSEIANKIYSHLIDNQGTIDQILANDPFKNLLRQIYGSVTAHFFDSTALSYLDENRESDRKRKFIAALNKSFTSVKMIQSTPIQQTDGTYKQGTDEENAGNGCGPITVEHSVSFLHTGEPVTLSENDIHTRAQYIAETRQRQAKQLLEYRRRTEVTAERIDLHSDDQPSSSYVKTVSSTDVKSSENSSQLSAYIPIDSDDFIEISPNERTLAPHMQTLNTTGRPTNDQSEFFPDWIENDIERERICILNLDDKERLAISSKYQQDIFTGPADLIMQGNPNIRAETIAKATIYKNRENEIFADCVVDAVNLSVIPKGNQESTHSDLTKIRQTNVSGKILFRYKWENDNWHIQFTGTTDIRLKKLLLGQYPELDKIRALQREVDQIDSIKSDSSKKKNKSQKNQSHSAEQITRQNQLKAELNNLTEEFIHKVAATIPIPVSGKIGSNADDCFITVKDLERSLRRFVRDRNLEIVPREQNGTITLKIYTTGTISLFEDIGLKKIRDANNHSYYEVTIDRNTAKQNPDPKEHLFGLRIRVNGESKSIDVSHLFTKEQIQHFRSRARAKADRAHSQATVSTSITETQPTSVGTQPVSSGTKDPVLTAIRKVNHYLTRRAGVTSGLFASITGYYNGSDYYKRRTSWKKILKKINAHINDLNNPNPDLQSRKKLLNFILSEANKFDQGFLGLFQSNYYTALINLHAAISQNRDYDFKAIAAPIATYCQIYDEMDMYKSAAKKYVDNYSAFFTSSKEKKGKIRADLERELYDAHYDTLSEEDKNDFMDSKTEHMSEYDNMRRFDY